MNLQSQETPPYAGSTPLRLLTASAAYALTAVIVAVALMTLIGESLATLTDIQSIAIAAGSAALAGGATWYWSIEHPTAQRERKAPAETGFMVGLLTPAFVWFGFALVALPQQLLATPGAIVSFAFVVVTHVFWLSAPLGYLTGRSLGRLLAE